MFADKSVAALKLQQIGNKWRQVFLNAALIAGRTAHAVYFYEYSTFASISCWFTGKILFSSNISHHSEEFLNKNLSDEVLKNNLKSRPPIGHINLKSKILPLSFLVMKLVFKIF